MTNNDITRAGSGSNEFDVLLQSDLQLTGDPEGSLFKQVMWGVTRHEAIAGAAEILIGERSRLAISQIVALLGSGTTLKNLAGWADQIKRRKPRPGDDDETVAFLEDPRNSDQDQWHFVNLPLDAEGYDRVRYLPFTRDKDVVQITRECVRVLKGESDRFSKLNALRLITHMTGDLHQPVHVGCAFIDPNSNPSKLIRDPDAIIAGGFDHDRGGNNLILPNNSTLHSYWDSTLGGKAMPDGVTDASELKQLLIRKLATIVRAEPWPASFKQTDPVDMPASWATSSLLLARVAYQSLVITGPSDKEKNKFAVSWDSKAAYDARCAPIVKKQLTQAARSLATILDSIFA